MIAFTPAQRAEMDARHAAARPAPEEPAMVRNVPLVMELGGTVYKTFRGRAFGVPPVPWKLGQQLHLLWIEALRFQGQLTTTTAPRYYAIIAQLPDLLWRCARPVGRTRRLLYRLGLHHNPFRRATEAELVELAGFFLALRMRSSIGQPAQLPRRAWSIS